MSARPGTDRTPDARPALGGHQDLFYTTSNTQHLPHIVRGEGIYLFDAVGTPYIDVASGAVVNNLGQGNERVLAAMAEQGRKLTFSYVRVSRHEPNRMVADRVAALAGPGYERVHLSSGGSEANEMALKFLRQYAYATGQRDRTRVISCVPSYHGATLLTMAITGEPEYEAVYDGMITFSEKIPAPLAYRTPDGISAEENARRTVDALEETILRLGPEKVLAFVIEPVGGVSTGANVPAGRFFADVREVCDRYGVYLVFDEVMTACRTGTFLAAHQWPEARPDVVVLAKGLGAGYTPLGAMLAPARMVDELAGLTGFNLSHTYNANPITCAGAVAVLDELVERDLLGNARRMGDHLRIRLEELGKNSPLVGDVRGLGLLQAVEIVADKETKATLPREVRAPDRIRELGLRHGLMLYARQQNGGRYGEWFMVAPPLVITEEEVDAMVDRIGRTLDDFTDELTRDGLLG
ncbi:aminotransferase class III-fold pyridoxal phosphate-dependent enzyme [Streptomyces sp. DSM 3412]|uniref:Aminotransferase class III-fold pyridoxal phosphate-dependent enzyme n=1 Tax=Streptomyces gottesmaniae TaxID=3075518 RepID=A0ABU2Z119_9ACTN|nr:aminotransferase class III-fold pyridoxal phosphate-dependent enzyme [Streptomyces sp. DSM 3412]MDT0570277.1 aminotransferase class III-fold pyridoxal phosphate-dependent enzyme [Streptomyces sp. DSM 3412]